VTITAGEAVVADFSLVSVNQPPILDPIGNKSVDEGKLLQFCISASDPDGNSLVCLATNLPEGAGFDPVAQTFTWTPGIGQAGSYPDVHFQVSDGSLSDSEDITITVNAVSISSECDLDCDCDDGLFCNGAETCVGGTCVAGIAPCPSRLCDENTDTCVDCEFTLSISVDGTGTTDPSPGSYPYECSSNIPVTAIDTNPAWEFSHFVVDGETRPENPTTVHLGSDRNVIAYFVVATSDSHMSIDIPQPAETLSLPFIIAGWALDLGSSTGTGVDAIGG